MRFNSGHESPLESELNKYADPLLLPSRSRLPKSLSSILLLCQWLYISNPQMRQAVKRMVGHMVTGLSFRGKAGSPEEQKEFAKHFRETMSGFKALRLFGQDLTAYGIGLLRVYFPFNRQLLDRRGGRVTPFSVSLVPQHLVKFDLRTMTYNVPDPLRRDLPWEARPRVNFPFRDIRRKTFKGIKVLRLDPRYVKIRYSSWSDSRQIQYSFDPAMRGRVTRGELLEVNRTPIAILRAIRDKKDFLFDEEAIFVAVNDTISGVLDHGFGMPEPILSFPTLYKMATYDRLDETLSHEMMAPYRFASPAELRDERLDGAEFRRLVQHAFEDQRKDRTKIGVMPIPMNWQELGGNGKNLVPKELKDYEFSQLLRGLGIPEELYSSSLRLDMIPYAIRIFESANGDFLEAMNDATRWAVAAISRFMTGEEYDAVLEPSATADDASRRVMLRDLHNAQQIPSRLLMDALHLDKDPVELQVERGQEDLQKQEQLAELQAQYQRRAELGSLGDAVLRNESPTTGSTVTPVDSMDSATALAMEWLGLPLGQRQQAMRSVAAQNRQLYLMAKDIMESERSRGEAAGREMVYENARQ